MQLVCDGLDLGVATLKVIKAISNKTTNPILEGIKLTAINDTLVLSATDLELGIEKTIKAEVKEEGETVVPGRFFSEFIKKLANEKIELTLIDNRLKINYTDSESYVQCLNILEFPDLKIIEDGEYFTISQKNLKSLINKSIMAVALDDSRPILKGCLFEISDNDIKSIALDGFRLAKIKMPIKKTTAKASIVVPARSLSEISKLIEDVEDDINVYIQKNFLMVDLNDTKIITRLLDGEFFNYEQIIPREFTTNILVNKSQLEDALDRTAILSRVDRNNFVKFDVKEKLLTLTSNKAIIGKSNAYNITILDSNGNSNFRNIKTSVLSTSNGTVDSVNDSNGKAIPNIDWCKTAFSNIMPYGAMPDYANLKVLQQGYVSCIWKVNVHGYITVNFGHCSDVDYVLWAASKPEYLRELKQNASNIFKLSEGYGNGDRDQSSICVPILPGTQTYIRPTIDYSKGQVAYMSWLFVPCIATREFESKRNMFIQQITENLGTGHTDKHTTGYTKAADIFNTSSNANIWMDNLK